MALMIFSPTTLAPIKTGYTWDNLLVRLCHRNLNIRASYLYRVELQLALTNSLAHKFALQALPDASRDSWFPLMRPLRQLVDLTVNGMLESRPLTEGETCMLERC